MKRRLTKRQEQSAKRLIRTLDKFQAQPKQDPFLDRIEKHLPRSDDMLSLILRVHLLAEELLNELISPIIQNKRPFEEARLSFGQLLAMGKAVTPLSTDLWVWRALTELNTIRNRLAHRLDTDDITDRVRDLSRLIHTQRPKNKRPPQPDNLREQLLFLLGMLAGLRTAIAEASRTGAIEVLQHIHRSEV